MGFHRATGLFIQPKLKPSIAFPCFHLSVWFPPKSDSQKQELSRRWMLFGDNHGGFSTNADNSSLITNETLPQSSHWLTAQGGGVCRVRAMTPLPCCSLPKCQMSQMVCANTAHFDDHSSCSTSRSTYPPEKSGKNHATGHIRQIRDLLGQKISSPVLQAPRLWVRKGGNWQQPHR